MPILIFFWSDDVIMFFVAFILLIVLSIVASLMAHKRGRSEAGWFLCALFLEPIVSIIILLLLGKTAKEKQRQIIEEEKLRAKIRQELNN